MNSEDCSDDANRDKASLKTMITKAQIYVDCTKFELKRLADECDVDVKTAINLLDIVRVSLGSARQMNKKCEMELQLLRAENKKLGMKIQPENVPKHDAKAATPLPSDTSTSTAPQTKRGEQSNSTNSIDISELTKKVENLILDNTELSKRITLNLLETYNDDELREVANLSRQQQKLIDSQTQLLEEIKQLEGRFMELQDAERWTEKVYEGRMDSTMDKKQIQSTWKFFSNRSSEGPHRELSTPHLRGATAAQTVPHQADFLWAESNKPHTRQERTAQFRQVPAHVFKEGGRTEAYGWSLPSKIGRAQKESVPMPVFFRPIKKSEPRMELLCAAGVNLSGGRTPDGACMVGENAFYAKEDENSGNMMHLAEEMSKATLHSPEVEQISQQLRATRRAARAERSLSSLVWICASTRARGVVMIIDANNPAEVMESFPLGDKHILCVASVPGAVGEDYREYEERMAAGARSEGDKRHSALFSAGKSESTDSQSNGLAGAGAGEAAEKEVVVGATRLVQATVLTPPSTPLSATPVDKATHCCEDAPDRKMSTVMATMWLGTKSGNLYVHSAVGNYSKCLARVKLNDAILSIVACASRCVVALADGTVAMFMRLADGQWDFSQYWLLTLGDPKCSVRCLAAVGVSVWCGYSNKVYVLEPRTRRLLHSLEAHACHVSQVRQMACDGDGVWVSFKLDSTLRLFHAHTYQHLQDVDIEPYVSQMGGMGKMGFWLMPITALLISSGRLWIGTSNGVVISVPLSEGGGRDSGAGSLSLAPAGSVSAGSPAGALPWCSMAHAQLSFHGHHDAVTFLVAVPGAAASPARTCTPPARLSPQFMLVISGGEGYTDFRIGRRLSGPEDDDFKQKIMESHLIVWQTFASMNEEFSKCHVPNTDLLKTHMDTNEKSEVQGRSGLDPVGRTRESAPPEGSVDDVDETEDISDSSNRRSPPLSSAISPELSYCGLSDGSQCETIGSGSDDETETLSCDATQDQTEEMEPPTSSRVILKAVRRRPRT